jgi:uncharacterized protein YabN with tetrapyrrole methylase and pyrophosphatase domain
MTPSPPIHIYIAGLGLQTVTQITRQVQQAIQSSTEVLFVDTGIATRTFLESLCPKVTPLFNESYSQEASRATAYEHMAARVVEAALDHPPVTFALHGHPLVAARPPFLVLQLAAALGLRVAVLPGISAIDSIMADLHLDPVIHGIQMFEATDVLLRRRPLQPEVPTILWQIGVLETCLHSQAVSRPERYTRLIRHLLQFYPPEHEVVAIYCAPHAVMPPAILRFHLQDMGAHAEKIHAGFSLYVPPAHTRPIQDHDLFSKLYSLDHLRNITETHT